MISNPLIPRLEESGINVDSFATAQVLCLPENFLHAADGAELLETADMTILVKTLREKDVGVFTFFDAGIDLSAIDRRSGDKWFGTIWIRDNAVMPIVASVIGGLIVLGIQKSLDEPSASPPPPAVHLEIIVGSTRGETTIRYDGDGETLVKVLKPDLFTDPMI